MKCVFGFTPNLDCNNCGGDGVFAVDDNGTPTEACAFCLEGRIMDGEIDGVINGQTWKDGKPCEETEQDEQEMHPIPTPDEASASVMVCNWADALALMEREKRLEDVEFKQLVLPVASHQEAGS